MTAAPHSLRVEHLDQALGITVPAPRFSWQLPGEVAAQLGYRIRTTNGWDSGRAASEQSVLVPYAGPALRSRQRVDWQVKVWTERGESDWSPPAPFELGLTDPADWRASWVEPGEDPPGRAPNRAAALFRTEFDVVGDVGSARLYATAHGSYEGFLNGTRVGDLELTPGFTQYRARLQVQTFDVTDALRPGRNAIGVILADGWYRGQIGITRATEQWGNRLGLLAQLVLTYADGSTTVVGTGPHWRSGLGHIVAADLIGGEHCDLREYPDGWSKPGFDDSSWALVNLGHGTQAALVDSAAPPVRRVQELIPISVTRLDERRQIVDLGQNINGWLRLSRLGPAGTRVRLVHGEWLAPDGDVTTEHLRPAVPFLPEPLPAGQVDEVVSAGRAGEHFEPRRTTHGFRYVRIEDHPENLTPADVIGVVVHSDLRRTGWFRCSDERVNRGW